MSWPIDKNVAMGQLGLAISFEHLRARQVAGELTDDEVSAIVAGAISRFPLELQGQLRLMLQEFTVGG